jgi:hypothetical protein
MYPHQAPPGALPNAAQPALTLQVRVPLLTLTFAKPQNDSISSFFGQRNVRRVHNPATSPQPMPAIATGHRQIAGDNSALSYYSSSPSRQQSLSPVRLQSRPQYAQVTSARAPAQGGANASTVMRGRSTSPVRIGHDPSAGILPRESHFAITEQDMHKLPPPGACSMHAVSLLRVSVTPTCARVDEFRIEI